MIIKLFLLFARFIFSYDLKDGRYSSPPTIAHIRAKILIKRAFLLSVLLVFE